MKFAPVLRFRSVSLHPAFLHCAFLLVCARASAQAHPEIVVACDAAGKLVAKFDAAKPYPLTASMLTWIEGYAGAIPGVSSLFDPAPAEGLFPPDPKSNLVLVFHGADEGAAVWNDRGTDLMRPGETFGLGAPFFDTHPIWNLAKGAPNKPHAIRMQLRDKAGIHKDSDVFAPTFSPDDGRVLFGCPMRCGGAPTFEKAGKCAECGMALKLLTGRVYKVSVKPEPAGGETNKAEDNKTDTTNKTADATIRAGAPVTLRTRIEAPDGKLASNLEIVHEKLLHLLLVSNDLAWFAHEHPEIQSDGTFLLTFTFPAGGSYTLYHDFTPGGVGMQVVPIELQVAGPAPAPRPLEAGARKQQIDGYTFELSVRSALGPNPRNSAKAEPADAPVLALQMQQLTVKISRAGAPVDDLEPFLGAMGHLIVIHDSRKHFVHSHPLERPTGGVERNKSEVVFNAQFPVPGRYKAWAQFQHKGKVLTAPFIFDVLSPRDYAEQSHNKSGGAASRPQDLRGEAASRPQDLRGGPASRPADKK
jgi:hypothetical protein